MEAWGREAYAVDCPGHGTRLHEIEGVTLVDYPRVVIEFIEERGPDRVVLVGNSTGGLVCQLVAQEIPEGCSTSRGTWPSSCGTGSPSWTPVPGVLGPPRRDDRQPLPGAAPRHHPGTVDAGHVRRRPTRRSCPLAAPTVAIVHRQARPRPVLQRPARPGDPEELLNGVKDVCFDWDYRRAGIPGCPATSRTSATPRCRAATAASTVTPRSWPSRSSSSPSTSTAARLRERAALGEEPRLPGLTGSSTSPRQASTPRAPRVSSGPGFSQR